VFATVEEELDWENPTFVAPRQARIDGTRSKMTTDRRGVLATHPAPDAAGTDLPIGREEWL